MMAWISRVVLTVGAGLICTLGAASLSAEEEAAAQQPSDEKDAAKGASEAKESAPTPKRKEKEQEKISVDRVSQDPIAGPACPEMSSGERELLLSLKTQREELIRREALLEKRRAALKNLESELEAKMGPTLRKLEALERQLEVGDARRKQAKDRFRTLVAAISSLSPRRAAPMLAQLAPDDAVRILILLGPERSGEVLSKMEPNYAAALITLVSKEASIPGSSSRQRRGRGGRGRR